MVGVSTLEQFVPWVSNISSFINPVDRTTWVTTYDIYQKLLLNNYNALKDIKDWATYNNVDWATIWLMKLLKEDLVIKDLDNLFENVTWVSIWKADRTHKESPLYKTVSRLKTALKDWTMSEEQIQEYIHSNSYKNLSK
jgi:hypothetical protein